MSHTRFLPLRRADCIKQQIEARWNDQRLHNACAHVIDFIAEASPTAVEEITLSTLSKASGYPPSSETFQKTLAVLSSRYSVLEWHFVYFLESGEPYYLESHEIADFMIDGTFVDPDKGEVIEDSQRNIFPFFSADRDYLLSEVE